MAAAQYFEQVQKIFIAFYQRPADPAGLKYWAERVDAAGGNINEVINAFASSAEATTLYGAIDATTIGAVVDSLYMALFNVAPDAAGKAFYVDGFAAGTFTAGTIALAVLNGAQNDDLIAVNNKVQVANEFTHQVDGRALSDAYFGTGSSFNVTYSGDADTLAARGILKAVTFLPATVINPSQVTEQLKAQIANPGDAITGQTGGQTFTLTTNLDAPGATSPSVNTQGTGGNDIYKGVVGTTETFNTTDNLDGAGGVDTLELTSVGAAAVTVTPLFMTNVEKVSIKDTDATALAGTTVNLANTTGVTEVVNNGSVDNIAFQGIGKAAVTVQNMTGTTTTTFARSATAPVTDALTLNLTAIGNAAATNNVAAVQGGSVLSLSANNAATAATINATGYVSVAQVELTGTGGANHTATSLTINAAGTTIFNAAGAVGIIGFDTTKSAAITVTGAGAVALNSLAAVVQTVDASANTGGVTLVGTQYNTGTNAAALAAPGLKLTGGTGNDSFTFDGVATAVVDLGTGNNTATVNAGTLTAGASIKAGAGTADTINFVNADIVTLSAQSAAGTALRATVSGFEKLGVSNVLSTAINAAQAGAYNYVVLAGSVDDGDVGQNEGTVNLTGLTTGATVELRAIAAVQAGAGLETGADALNAKTVAAGVQEDILNVVMTDAATTSTDVLNLKLAANLTNANSTAQATYKVGIQGINNVNVTAVDRFNDVLDDAAAATAQDGGADEGYTLALSSAANLNKLTIAGTSAVSYTLAADAAAVTLIDASASTGNVVINVAAFAGTERVEIKGSQGVNTITGDDAAFGEKITGGAKADSITGGAGADDMTGNGGRDAFIQGAGASGLTAATVDQISDFGKVTVAVTAAEVTAQGTVAAFQAANTARGGDNADIIDFQAVTATAVATAQSAADDAAINVALEALDGTQTEFAGKVINATIAKGVLTLGGADAAMVDTLAEWVAVANVAAGVVGETAAFLFNGNTYLFQQQLAGDELVELTGTTGVTGVVLVGSAVAAAVGDIFIL